jgi:hypothetical protein
MYFKDSHLKTLDTRVKFTERFNLRVEATPNRCTYAVNLFDQVSEKAINDFMLEYLVPKIEYSTNSSQTRKIQITHHLLTCQALGGC